MFLYLGIALGAGFILSNQTPINTDLRRFAGSPILSGLISFFVGTLFLALITLLMGGSLLPGLSFIAAQPWWIWLGGLLGAIYLTSNILLFPKLGALQTVILPICGQIAMGIVIDSFGLFQSPQIPITIMRAVGFLLLVAGVVIAIVLPALLENKKLEKQPKGGKSGSLLGWRLWGIVIGMLGAMQQAINGHLGVALHDTADASFISFFIGTVLILIVALIVDKHLPRFSELKKAKPWNFLGGILGALFVFATVVSVPQIGAGLTIMMGLLGQILGSIFVQQFGWWRSPKYRVQVVQIVGIIVMLAGIIFIKFL